MLCVFWNSQFIDSLDAKVQHAVHHLQHLFPNICKHILFILIVVHRTALAIQQVLTAYHKLELQPECDKVTLPRLSVRIVTARIMSEMRE